MEEITCSLFCSYETDFESYQLIHLVKEDVMIVWFLVYISITISLKVIACWVNKCLINIDHIRFNFLRFQNKGRTTNPGPLRIPALQLIGLPWLNKVVLPCLDARVHKGHLHLATCQRNLGFWTYKILNSLIYFQVWRWMLPKRGSATKQYKE